MAFVPNCLLVELGGLRVPGGAHATQFLQLETIAQHTGLYTKIIILINKTFFAKKNGDKICEMFCFRDNDFRHFFVTLLPLNLQSDPTFTLS